MKIPVYDRKQQFTLHRVHHLPLHGDGNSAWTWTTLPDVLAVATDAQTFVELSHHDVDQCSGKENLVCHFHGGVAKRQRPLTCATTLFLGGSPKTIQQLCQPKKIPWSGSTTVYLGRRRWALSDRATSVVTVACRSEQDRSGHTTVPVPTSGVFELPPGCTGHTAEWLFPASTVGVESLSSRGTEWWPHQLALPQWPGSSRHTSVSRVGSTTGTDQAAAGEDDLEQRQAALLKDIDTWIATTAHTSNPNTVAVPVLGVTLLLLFGAIAVMLYRRHRRLEHRLRRHEELEVEQEDPPLTGIPSDAPQSGH